MVESRSGNCADWRLDRDVRICGIAHIYLFILTSCQVSFAKNPNNRTTKACRHSTESPLRPLLNFFCTVTPYYQKHLVGEMSLFECAFGILVLHPDLAQQNLSLPYIGTESWFKSSGSPNSSLGLAQTLFSAKPTFWTQLLDHAAKVIEIVVSTQRGLVDCIA